MAPGCFTGARLSAARFVPPDPRLLFRLGGAGGAAGGRRPDRTLYSHCPLCLLLEDTVGLVNKPPYEQ